MFMTESQALTIMDRSVPGEFLRGTE